MSLRIQLAKVVANFIRVCDYARKILEKTLWKQSKIFCCGAIYINRRHDNHHYDLLRYCVRRQVDLRNKIVPFFRQYPLQSAKGEQFNKFCERNFKGLESSTTIRQSPDVTSDKI